MADLRVRCLPPELSQGGNEKLRFEVNGRSHALSLQLRGFNRLMLQSLPDRAMDLLEIAALVYGLDAAVSRGGLTDRQMGAQWYRTFQVTMPVRDLEVWLAKDVSDALTETLFTLSGDRFFFNFVRAPDNRLESGWLDLGNEDVWQADRVLMFSGGLDSFAGALEEIADHGHKVALVSHQSSNTIGKVQSDLVAHLRRRFGSEACRHFPLKAQLAHGSNLEGTHRTRSFLFAAIGQVTAMAFAINRVSFHENGLVSLNLPPVKSVVGTKATRTTHPQVLPRVSDLFSRVFNTETRVDNPFFWRTKTEVMETIARLGASEQVAFTSSCADTRNRTNQHPHCGRCSQCIDRRFAALAAGLAQDDPAEAYAVDLIEGVREDVRDREMGLGFRSRSLLTMAHPFADAFAHADAV